MVKAVSFCVVEASSKRAARRKAAVRWSRYVIGRAYRIVPRLPAGNYMVDLGPKKKGRKR